MKYAKINVGDRVKDRISGLQGIAIARTEWLWGCVRITLQPEGATKDHRCKESVSVDEPQCVVVKRKVLANEDMAIEPGGPHPEPQRLTLTRGFADPRR